MKIRILTVGKIKEKFYRDAIAEYQKRLGRPFPSAAEPPTTAQQLPAG